VDSVRRDDRRGRPLRLLWLIDSLAMGGAERLAVAFAREAAPAGIDLHVCCLKRIGGNPLERDLRDTGVSCHVLDAAHLRDRRAFARLRRLLRDGRFDPVHAHLTYAAIWGAAAARLEGVPSVATLHVPPESGPPWRRERIRERLMCALVTRCATTAIAVSAALRDRYVRQGLLDPAQTIVVHNGVDTDGCPTASREHARRLRLAFGLAPDATVLMATAVLRDRRKGLHVLLDALPQVFAAHPAARLVVIGDGPLRRELEAQAQRLGVAGNVCWAGQRHDVGSLLAGADVYVHPPLAEPFPTAVLEAMAASLPVVSTRVDGIPEMIADGSNGRLVPPGDAAALGAALVDLLSDSRARGALAAAARRTALDRFSTRVWIRALGAVYERALGPGSPARKLADTERLVAP
jgi:glycosyltransferase involved in cell wall biosynthesis